MNNKDLIETLFGPLVEQFKPKHLTQEEWQILFNLGYDPNSWDHWLDIGKVTKEDVQKRIDLENERLRLDRELNTRWEAKRPKIKKDDVIETKNFGKLMVRSINDKTIVAYSSKYGELLEISWNDLSKEMESK